MRTAALLVALAAGPALAQSDPYLAEVAADATVLRAGPADQMPATGELPRGARLVVVREEPNGWLAVQPPRGQVSWIKHLHLGPVGDTATDALPRNMVVNADPAAVVAPGDPKAARPLDVERTKIPDQTIVLVIGQRVKHRDTWWFPIEPPDEDFRYVQKSAVRAVSGRTGREYMVKSADPQPTPLVTPASATSAGGFQPVPASLSGGPTAAGKPADWPNNYPLWVQAEQAERAGDDPRAEAVYLRLAADLDRANKDPELANLCYARVHAIRERQRGGRTVAARETARPTEPPASGDKWVGPYRLRTAGFRYDGRPTFALVGPRNEVKAYAVAGSGVDLDRHVNLDVEVYGSVAYPGDLRGVGVMTVSRVQRGR
ncbi:MAG: SH3 domain-containing protein [Gemmataceae bacterium]